MLSEVGDLAGQHEVVAEQLAASVASDVSAVARELKDERKRVSLLSRLSLSRLGPAGLSGGRRSRCPSRGGAARSAGRLAGGIGRSGTGSVRPLPKSAGGARDKRRTRHPGQNRRPAPPCRGRWLSPGSLM